jgi:outer membrane lipoprotein-sorting protein
MRVFRLSGRGLAWLLVCSSLAANCQRTSNGNNDGKPSYSGQKPPLSAEQVAQNLQEKDEERAAALHQFSSRRVYRMQYRGFAGSYEAQMVVDVTYRAPNVKQFKVVSQSGSTFVIDHVFKRLMQSEQEFINDDNRQQTALNAQNYNFTFADYEVTGSGAEYVLNISPRKKNRFLYRGKIWVDAKDFAVVRIEAEPAQNPSIWIKKTEIDHSYEKVGDFWLPAQDHTDSQIRLGGEAMLSIDYQNYAITSASPLTGTERARADSK